MIADLRGPLAQLKAQASKRNLRQLFEREPDRLARLCASAAGLRLDLSKNLLNLDDFSRLLGLAETAGVRDRINAMYAGEVINRTEQRSVLHTALRRGALNDHADEAIHAAEIRSVLGKLKTFVDAVHSGRALGYSGKRFTDVVNIGIGGSHLGPQLACDALRYTNDSIVKTHFLANVDGGEFDRIVTPLDPETTLFVIASKSFTTVETRLNAQSARSWFASAETDREAIERHFIAVSANPQRAVEFGISPDNVYPMWDWVGGRYSMWSAIGIPIALRYGFAVFAELLAGAATMDEHFHQAPFERNLPLLLGMIGIWNTNVLDAPSYAVIPYDDRLRYLPDYLQQLEMESNGKRTTNHNEVVDHQTAPVTWGGLGTNAQHAFFQLLHQGTRLIPVDFIVALSHPVAANEHHDLLIANCIAQAEGLMNGSQTDPSESADDGLAQHRNTPGNRPSTMLTVDELTAHSLGALIALYEHKTFVQSVIWDINAFDQWGVELGKQLATSIVGEITEGSSDGAHDPSTSALIERYLSLRKN